MFEVVLSNMFTSVFIVDKHRTTKATVFRIAIAQTFIQFLEYFFVPKGTTVTSFIDVVSNKG